MGGERPPEAARRRGERGFTVPELVVATLVLLLALLLAADLLDESGRLLHHSVRRARDGNPLLAAELLRNDILGAHRPAATGGDWVRLPLDLVVPDVGLVTWRRDGLELVRGVAGAGERRLLGGVYAFRWRTLPVARGQDPAVEVEVELRTADPWGTHAGRGLPRADRGRVERLHWLVVPGIERTGW